MSFIAGGNRQSSVIPGGMLHRDGETHERPHNFPHDSRQIPQLAHIPRDEYPSRSHVSFIDVGKMAAILNSGFDDSAADEKYPSGRIDSNPLSPNCVPLWIRIL